MVSSTSSPGPPMAARRPAGWSGTADPWPEPTRSCRHWAADGHCESVDQRQPADRGDVQGQRVDQSVSDGTAWRPPRPAVPSSSTALQHLDQASRMAGGAGRSLRHSSASSMLPGRIVGVRERPSRARKLILPLRPAAHSATAWRLHDPRPDRGRTGGRHRRSRDRLRPGGWQLSGAPEHRRRGAARVIQPAGELHQAAVPCAYARIRSASAARTWRSAVHFASSKYQG